MSEERKYNKKALLKEMKRAYFPEGFRLEAHPIIIEVLDREYGIVCECGSKDFSEDKMFGKLFCSVCNKLLAVRAVETGWVTEED